MRNTPASKYFDVLDTGVFSHGGLAFSFMVFGALMLCHVDADPLLVVNASEVYRPPESLDPCSALLLSYKIMLALLFFILIICFVCLE